MNPDILQFTPIPMERVWGGRNLEKLGRTLPPGAVVGESWELVDRKEALSAVTSGPWQGRTLGDLWTHERTAIFGSDLPDSERFPLLIKLLDATERLSLQVHPPAELAPSMGGEPKTECWYILDSSGGGEIFAGLKNGVNREAFESALAAGTAEELVHKFLVERGDCLFIPSGRLHAIGTGNVILETQQNSDTTYRVFDWNRLGLDGKPRELHIPQSLASIDFQDFEPAVQARGQSPMVECSYFRLDEFSVPPGEAQSPFGEPGRFSLIYLLEGSLSAAGAEFGTGDFLLAAASAGDLILSNTSSVPARFLRIVIPRA